MDSFHETLEQTLGYQLVGTFIGLSQATLSASISPPHSFRVDFTESLYFKHTSTSQGLVKTTRLFFGFMYVFLITHSETLCNALYR